MGTLTAHQVRLPENCEHKLPTSCRLTSIPACCACADERAHAPTYSTYIDGIGFVPRGNRWQRYCWYCKEFWENRVRVSGLLPAQTKIPEVPDQSEFLQRWYEFHKGYRIVSSRDGREERVSVLGEDFKDVSPGCLPRTLEELRAGREAAEVQQPVIPVPAQPEADSGPTLDEALDQMFADVENVQQSTAVVTSTDNAVVLSPPVDAPLTSNIHAQAMTPAPNRNREQQLRRVAALRRELIRMRGGIERVVTGLRDLGERIPDQESLETMRRLDRFIETAATGEPQAEEPTPNTTSNVTSNVTTTATSNPLVMNLQQRVDEARARYEAATRSRSRAASVLAAADDEQRLSSQRLQQLQREQRTMENYTRVFGTREEMSAQGESYESPIGGMFSRAYERFRAAEDVRREERTLRQVLEDEERIDTNEAVSRRLEELESRERDVWGVRATLYPNAAVPAVQSLEHGHLPDVFDAHRTASNAIDIVTPMHRSGDNEETPTSPLLTSTVDEAALQEYFSFFRDPNWDLRPPAIPPYTRILEAYRARRMRDHLADSDGHPDPPEEPLPPFSQDDWWQTDAEMVVRALTSDESLREAVGLGAQDAAVLLSYFIDGMISEADLSTIDGLMRNPTVIWAAGLPAEWLRKQTERLGATRDQIGLFFPGDGEEERGNTDWAAHHNPYIAEELTAQAFMMSAEIRRLAVMLTPPERLQMLYRLQSGRRSSEDMSILGDLYGAGGMVDETKTRILVVYYRAHFGRDDTDVERMNEDRRQMVNAGDHSRGELEARRRATSNHAFALAAGRQAMQTGSQALIEQMAAANQDNADTSAEAGTRAAFRRLQVNGFAPLGTRERYDRRTTLYRQLTLDDYMTSSPGSSRSSSPDSSRGLDAQDSGRPGPKSDEELQVSMECKVCYTQMADIACLPCGHLVMCKWCSEQHSPCLAHDRTRPRRPASCPVCRKGIKQKVRVFRA